MSRSASARTSTRIERRGAPAAHQARRRDARVCGARSDSAPRTLVCHPGGPGMSGAYFGDMCGLGSEDLRVVLLDPRGTGTSDPPADGRYELEDYAADLEELREELGLERFDYLGHSHGGFVGMTYALEQSDRLDRLVLACTTARFSDEHPCRGRGRIRGAQRPALVRGRRRSPAPPPGAGVRVSRQSWSISTPARCGCGSPTRPLRRHFSPTFPASAPIPRRLPISTPGSPPTTTSAPASARSACRR